MMDAFSTNILSLLTALFLQFLNLEAPTRTDATQALSIKTAAAENHQKTAALLAENPNYWSAPFVLADRKNREVTVWAQMTGMIPGDTLEFFIISEKSGHDYESLVMSFALPSDIHKAMEFIGAKAGGPVDTDTHRFWPRGDRFVAQLELKLPGAEAPERVAIEQFVTLSDGTVMKPLPWVFTGSVRVPASDEDPQPVYAADLHSPNCIATTFNLSGTVFDLPNQGSKSQVYGNFIRNPALKIPEATPVLLRLSPAPAGSVPTDVDIQLRLSEAGAPASVDGVEGLREGTLAQLAETLKARPNENHFIRVEFGDNLRLADLIPLARELQLLEQNLTSVRMEPPPPGHLFFQAFVPDPRFRKRADRPSQPLELHLQLVEGKASRATLYQLEEVWGESRDPSIVETRVALDDPKAWAEWMTQNNPRITVLFLYVPLETRHADILSWVKPVVERFPVIFVYAGE
jgi:hypothetical protein